MKDPADKKERSYEVLGLTQTATLAEINSAYARLAAKHPARRQELTNAWQCLRKPETRLEEDLWYYPAGEAEGTLPETPDSSTAVPWDPAVPPLDFGIGLTDLAEGRYRRDFSPLLFREVKLRHLDHYDEDPLAMLPIEFEK